MGRKIIKEYKLALERAKGRALRDALGACQQVSVQELANIVVANELGLVTLGDALSGMSQIDVGYAGEDRGARKKGRVMEFLELSGRARSLKEIMHVYDGDERGTRILLNCLIEEGRVDYRGRGHRLRFWATSA